MKLTPDNAQLCVHEMETDGKRACLRHVATVAEASAVLFTCPLSNPGHHHMVLVYFAAHPGGAPVAPPDWRPLPRWNVTGTTLTDLTISPSINLDVVTDGCSACGGEPNPCQTHPGAPRGWQPSCRWHGFVTKGEAA